MLQVTLTSLLESMLPIGNWSSFRRPLFCCSHFQAMVVETLIFHLKHPRCFRATRISPRRSLLLVFQTRTALLNIATMRCDPAVHSECMLTPHSDTQLHAGCFKTEDGRPYCKLQVRSECLRTVWRSPRLLQAPALRLCVPGPGLRPPHATKSILTETHAQSCTQYRAIRYVLTALLLRFSPSAGRTRFACILRC